MADSLFQYVAPNLHIERALQSGKPAVEQQAAKEVCERSFSRTPVHKGALNHSLA